MRYGAPGRAVADPWVALTAVAAATDRIRLGPLVRPLARRRVQKLGVANRTELAAQAPDEEKRRG